ncbi:MAG: DUF2892 domain-containing protein [Anaerolineae bacterium]|nr:DUF2892 domain-containing protein [Anaerolineae bacterium]
MAAIQREASRIRDEIQDALQTENQGTTKINVGANERVGSVIGGAALIAYGLMRGNVPGFALALVGGNLIYQGVTGYSFVYDKLGVNRAVTGLSEQVAVPHYQGVRVEKVMTIDKSPEELYRYWRNLENLPRFMKHVESVTQIDNKRSHWVALGPANLRVEWDAEIINEVANELIGWRSLEGSAIDNAGSVRFRRAPGDRGTEVEVNLNYAPPLGKAGALIAKLFGKEPAQQINADLRRFKQVMETGEIPTNDGQPEGNRLKRSC